MTVSLNIATTSGSSPFALPQEMGTLSPGSSSTAMNLFIRHTGTSKIEDTKIYILPYSAGVYLGSNTAQTDFDTTLGWGNTSYGTGNSGGFYLSMDHAGAFGAGSFVVFRTGWGDSLTNAVTLDSDSLNIGSGTDGEIPALGEAHIKLRVDIPSGYLGGTGTLYLDVLIPFSSTS